GGRADGVATIRGDCGEEKKSSHPSRHICCGQPLVTTGCGYLPTGYLPTGYLPTGYLPIGAAATGGGSLRGKSAAAAALSTVNNPTVPNTAMNPAVLTTARNAVVTRTMIFITLSPFVEALGRATEGCPYLPSGRAVSTAVLISFAEHDFARHNVLNERLTRIFTKSLDQVATAIAGSRSLFRAIGLTCTFEQRAVAWPPADCAMSNVNGCRIRSGSSSVNRCWTAAFTCSPAGACSISIRRIAANPESCLAAFSASATSLRPGTLFISSSIT